jgi:EpsD family peptidyl-prolyl cis-trans isomerase
LALAACSRGNSETGASQLVAKVNKSEITVSQLNAALARVPNLNPESTKAASKQVLQQLIDQELLVQKAREAKLDRNPGVVQALESARRAVLANAWLQQAGASVAQPSDQDIQAYFDQHPEYFSARRVYDYRAIPIRTTAAQVQSIQQQVAATPNLDSVLSALRASGTAVVVNPVTQSSEQLPPLLRTRFAQAKDGDILSFQQANGIELIQLVDSRAEPVDMAQARPFIQKFLLEQRRKQRLEQEIASLRAAASIEYLGEFKPAVGQAPAKAGPPVTGAAPATAPAPASPAGTADPAAGIASGIH